MGALKIKMSTNRINNVSLFVTVLSACLGLLVFGTPIQVRAQQATEAEIDEPDCSPSRLEEEARKAYNALGIAYEWHSDFIQLFNSFTDDKDNLQGSFDIEIIVEFSKGGAPQLTSKFSTTQRRTGVDRSRVDQLAEELYPLAEDFASGANGAGKKHPSPVQFEFRLDEAELYASVKFNQASADFARRYADAYNKDLAATVCMKDGASDLKYLLYYAARAIANGSQVMIVTRLPRATLDALLESEAAAQ